MSIDKLEEFLGDAEHFELADGSAVDITEASAALAGMKAEIASSFWKGRLEAAEQMRKKDEEIARLRAALEKIASCGDAGWVEDYGDTAVEYARAALAPGPTSKPRPSFCQAEFSACEFPDCACPEKEPHIQAHGPFPGAPFKP